MVSTRIIYLIIAVVWCLGPLSAQDSESNAQNPNILLVMGEDISWAHFSAYGEKAIETPVFDQLGQQGVLFTNAYCPAPTCGPSRSSILTGRPIWQLGPAASIYMPLPAEYGSYQNDLEGNGYRVGYAGKGWGPGEFDEYDRARNAAGPRYDAEAGISTESKKRSYADNFANFNSSYAADLDYFLANDSTSQPFSFWVGTSDAHRGFDAGSYLKAGIDPNQVQVPPFFPDTPEVRKEIADYLYEVQRFDQTVGQLIEVLKNRGKYENTIIIITADHGWSFPRGKGSLYEYGMHVPLVIHHPNLIAGGRQVDAFVNLNQIAPTLLELAKVKQPEVITTKSFAELLTSQGTTSSEWDKIILGHERHSPYRTDGLGYPMRGIRTDQYYYINNKKPTRWPAGAPPHYADPSDDMIVRALVLDNKDEKYRNYFELSYGRRPAEELYDMNKDPFQLNNLAKVPKMEPVRARLRAQMDSVLIQTNDPRALADSTAWDSMPWIWKWRYLEFQPNDQEARVKVFERKYKTNYQQ